MSTLVAIDAPHFYSGVVVRDGVVVDAAPILNWTKGRRYEWLADYCRRKGWKVTLQKASLEHDD